MSQSESDIGPFAIEVENLTKRFGGVTATNDVTLKVPVGECRAIIGPNGAGKTTFFNLLNGRLTPTSGTIRLNGTNITGLPVHRIARLGVGRTMQVTSLFPQLSIERTVAIGLQSCMRFLNPFGSARAETREKVEQYIDAVGLRDEMSMTVGNLSYGDQRLLEIALALSQEPRVLLLDEPTAGLSEREIPKVVSAIRKLTGKLTILIVEHRMSVVMDLAQRITVLNYGAIFAHGSPDEIMRHSGVQEIYLGKRA